MNGPKHVILGNALLFQDGNYYPAGNNEDAEFTGEEMDWLLLTNAARPVQVGDVVTIDGLTLTVTEVVE